MHWIRDIDIRRYPDDTRILPTNNTIDVYQYSVQQLKYLPEDALATVRKTFLYNKNPVNFTGGTDRRSATATSQADRTDDHLNERINAFKDYLFRKNRTPPGFLVNLTLINAARKTDIIFIFTLERHMNKLFKSREKFSAIPDEPDTSIQFHDMPYISYQEISLTQNFDIYFSSVLRSRTFLKMQVLNSPINKCFK